jgi:hypothetical protein
MIHRNTPARGKAGGQTSTRGCDPADSRQPERDAVPDDGLVYWPSSLGKPDGPTYIRVAPSRASVPEGKKPRPRRLGTSVLFAFLFFAGAALTAAAGNEVASLVASDTTATSAESTATGTESTATTTTADESTSTETQTSTDPTTTESVPGETVPETTTGAEPPAAGDPGASDDPASGEGSDPAAPPESDPGATDSQVTVASEPPSPPPASDQSGDLAAALAAAKPLTDRSKKSRPPAAKPKPVLPPSGSQPVEQAKRGTKAKGQRAYTALRRPPRASEVEPEPAPGLPDGDVLWLRAPLPDPTPPSLRLSPEFAKELRTVAAAKGLDWALVLAVLRAEHLNRSGEVSLGAVRRTAGRLASLHVGRSDRATARAFAGSRATADRVAVLERYYRAIGLRALVRGLVASKDALATRLLADKRIEIYAGGREDIAAGRVDVRVLAMIAYLAESFGKVEVSCLISGHRLYARPGVVSAHIYGRGLDIAALDETPIYLHQQQGSVTELAIRQILLLPAEVLPRQVISLLGLGGPSFPLADHADHIHIGY